MVVSLSRLSHAACRPKTDDIFSLLRRLPASLFISFYLMRIKKTGDKIYGVRFVLSVHTDIFQFAIRTIQSGSFIMRADECEFSWFSFLGFQLDEFVANRPDLQCNLPPHKFNLKTTRMCVCVKIERERETIW